MTPKEKALKLPQKPGVYIMKDKMNSVIYVGKAKKLYNRVNSYFRNNSSHNSKTRLLASQIVDFDYIVTDTEFEALVLENSLIKKHKPKYNILLKDDKGYPSIRLSDEPFPRFSIVSKPMNDGARYFGPYGGRVESKRAVETVSQLLKLPTCKRRFPTDIGKGRPCLNSHIGRCDAVCSGAVSQEEYNARIERAAMILSGKTNELIKHLDSEMQKHAERLEFELAARLRDEVRAVKALNVKQKIISGMMADTDVFALFAGESKTVFCILHYIDGALLESETREIDTPVYADLNELLEEFLVRYYSGRTVLPKEIYLQYEIATAEAVSCWLSSEKGSKVSLCTPKRGEKLKQVKMAEQNAMEKALLLMEKQEKEKRVLGDLKKVLNLQELPLRIESYDISNTSGVEMVAGMIVFKNASPMRSEYRRFKIKTLQAQDDPKAMREVVSRRFIRYLDGDDKFSNKPDLILLDGGLLQTKAVVSFLEEKNINIPVFGMVKDDKHKTRAIIDAFGNEIGISANPAIFRFVSAIQDEVHRYSIAYHRKLRDRAVVESELTKIAGIGKKRADELLTKFKSISAIKNAGVDELSKVLPESVANELYRYYRNEEEECE